MVSSIKSATVGNDIGQRDGSIWLFEKRKSWSLPEDQMPELAEIWREAGLEALFKTSMKIYGRQEVDNGVGRKQR
eukprot:scaffold1739_cov251-Chaetoceros_neogracile.AAC.2